MLKFGKRITDFVCIDKVLLEFNQLHHKSIVQGLSGNLTNTHVRLLKEYGHLNEVSV